MPTTKVAITLDTTLLAELDTLVAQQVIPNRSRAIQVAVAEKLTRWRRTRLDRECAKLDPTVEQSLAEEGLSQELETWPVS